jgi:putative salt-induced outer membrane protein YdiY
MNIFKSLLFFTLFSSNILAQDCVSAMVTLHSNLSTLEKTKKLEQNFNMGFSNTTGNTMHLDVNAKYDLSLCTVSYNEQLLKIIFDSSIFFTQTDSEKSNEEYLLNLGLEQELDKEWLIYLALNWLRNPEFKNYDHKTSLGVGIGKNLFFDGSQSVTLKLGTAYNKEDYANTQKSDQSSSLNEYIEYKNQLNKISKLYFKTGALQHFHSFHEDYEVLAILGVNFTVGEKIHLTIEQEVAYDNLPPIGFKKTDTKSIVRLGYKF